MLLVAMHGTLLSIPDASVAAAAAAARPARYG